MMRQYLVIFIVVLVINSWQVSCSCIKSMSNECRVAGLNAANRRFSYTMLRKVAKQSDDSENIFLSPLVVGTMLSMLLQGSNGDTEDEIKAALKWNSLFDEDNKTEDPTKEEAHCVYKYYNGFSSNLTSEEDVLQLKTANRIFGGNWNFNKDVIETLNNFGAPLENVQFGTPEAVETINNWVSEKTHHRVNKVFEPGSLAEDTVLALVSAIYFKGLWETPFENVDGTRKFTLFSGEIKQVPFVERKGDFKYIRSHGGMLDIVEVPYKANDNGVCINASMIFVMDSKGNTTRVEHEKLCELCDKGLKSLLDELQTVHPSEAHVRFPKFAVTAEYDLVSILKSMGVKKLFSRQADLINFIDEDSRDGTLPLYVSKAVHKTYVQVDEKGTEAAAVSAAQAATMMQPDTFYFNKPFHFLIYDRTNTNILFIGRISDPSTAK